METFLFRDPIFMMYAASNFLTSIGFNVPYVFTPVSNLFLHLAAWSQGALEVREGKKVDCTFNFSFFFKLVISPGRVEVTFPKMLHKSVQRLMRSFAT